MFNMTTVHANTRDSPEPTPPQHTIVLPPDCETGPQPLTKGDMINFKQALTLTNAEMSSSLYYHQVQLQLYVTSANWCDFCVYTTKGIAIESIYPDMEWKVRNLPKLQYFYDNYCCLKFYFQN